MNKEFEQWLDEPIPHYDGVYERRRGILPEEVYDYLQANPHLLREDGEWTEEDLKEYAEFSNPRPTDIPCSGKEGESCNKNNNCTYPDCKDMEQEAREMCKKWFQGTYVMDVIFHDQAVAALTEFGMMWKGRGREDKNNVVGMLADTRIEVEKLKLQLAEKDDVIELATANIKHYQSELTAAKKQLAELKIENDELGGTVTDQAQQLAEKDDKILTMSAERNGWYTMYQNKKEELTAAKAEVVRLEQENADLKNALNNI